MRNIQTFQVFPFLPEPLAFLETLTRNLWWCWRRDAIELFRRIHPGLWYQCQGNPILFFTRIPQERLEGGTGQRQPAPEDGGQEQPGQTEPLPAD